MDTIDYKQYYTKYNEKRAEDATSLRQRDLDLLRGLVVGSQSKTLLDYGSGNGFQYSKYNLNDKFNINIKNITCYDIGVPAFSVLPTGKFDGVLCSDVLEHIPLESLDEAVGHIFNFATKFVYISIHCGLANNYLPDGSNVHCTVRPPSWWKDMLTKHNVNNLPLCTTFRIPTNPKNDILGLRS